MKSAEYILLGIIIILAVIHIIRRISRIAKGENPCALCKKCEENPKQTCSSCSLGEKEPAEKDD